MIMNEESPTASKMIFCRAKQLGVVEVFDSLIKQYPHFEHWSGSHSKLLHHYGHGGLAQHTWEVINLGLNTIPLLNLEEKVDPTEYFLAALFHDTGKMYDYKPKGLHFDEWEPVEHRRLIHHLPRSILIWQHIAMQNPKVADKYFEKVLHAILAHHGRRDQGSPVAPKTHVAWLLHLCDGISARMNDCDRMDVLDKK